MLLDGASPLLTPVCHVVRWFLHVNRQCIVSVQRVLSIYQYGGEHVREPFVGNWFGLLPHCQGIHCFIYIDIEDYECQWPRAGSGVGTQITDIVRFHQIAISLMKNRTQRPSSSNAVNYYWHCVFWCLALLVKARTHFHYTSEMCSRELNACRYLFSLNWMWLAFGELDRKQM